ncbi:MAG TPA: hypothetical protein VMT91_14860 [Anaerolineales bacterium]|nr:hypothetical protein [Anaerolineales bacterium]
MSIVAAISAEALRKSLEEVLDGLELELVYPKQTGAALTDPTQRVPGTTELVSGYTQFKYLFDFAVKLSIPDPGSLPAGKSFFEIKNGRIYINSLKVMLTRCDIKLALVFMDKTPFSLDFFLPFKILEDIPIPTAVFPSATISSGLPLNIPRPSADSDDLFSKLQTDLFGSSDQGLDLKLTLDQDTELAEISLDMKPVVVSTNRTVTVTQADGSKVDTDQLCWGLSFDEFLVILDLVPLGTSLLELLYKPLEEKAIAFATDILAFALAKDPLFIFLNANVSQIADYIADYADEQACKLALPGLQALVDADKIALGFDQGRLDDAKKTGIDALIGPAQVIVDGDNAKLAFDQGNVDKANQQIAEDQAKEQADMVSVVAAAHDLVGTIVTDFFNLQTGGIDLLLKLINMATEDLSQGFFTWFDSDNVFSTVLAGLMQDLLKDKIKFSLVPQTIETDLSGKIPDKLKGRLKLLPLDIDISKAPVLTIQQKELSVVVEVDG